jgi:hypothetical protein
MPRVLSSRAASGRRRHHALAQAKLNFRPEQEFADPFGIQDKLLSEHAKGM